MVQPSKGTASGAGRFPGKDATPPEQHAARLVRRFRADREKLLPWLAQGAGEGGGALEGFLQELAPSAQRSADMSSSYSRITASARPSTAGWRCRSR